MWLVVFFVLAEILLCCLTARYWHTWSRHVYTFLFTFYQAVVRGLMWLFAFDIMYRIHLITKWTKEQQEQEWKDTLHTGNRDIALIREYQYSVSDKNKSSATLLYLMPEMARRELEELIARDEPVAIDYEQPQTMYPELPQQ